MGRGPENFLSRLNRALEKYDLPSYVIVNPHPKLLRLLYEKDKVKVGRLDGAIYYKITQENFFNLVYQRRGKQIQAIKNIPQKVLDWSNYPINRYLNRSNRALLKKSDVIVYQSEFSKRMQHQFVGSSKKISSVILNGVPGEVFYPKKRIETETVDIVITASFRLHKRLLDAIDLVNALNIRNLQKYQLHIIGDMDVLTAEAIKSKDLSHCVFYGRVESELLPDLYKRFDLGVSPSLFDPCPNSVVEMIACGLPVISTSESGASELIQSGELIVKERVPLSYMELQTVNKIPKIDLQAWIEAVNRVLDDRNRYSEMMSCRFEDELNIEIAAEKYASLIGEYYRSRS